MRGRTFKNSFIIADEMQNSSPNQMLMLLTRIGVNSKIVITGDLAQSDRIENNGLKDFVYRLKNNKLPDNFFLVEMENSDIQRSQLVANILSLYNVEPSKETVVKENGFSDAALITKKDMLKLL
jgi:phosphate starvation-inducible PhoH-like protein